MRMLLIFHLLLISISGHGGPTSTGAIWDDDHRITIENNFAENTTLHVVSELASFEIDVNRLSDGGYVPIRGEIYEIIYVSQDKVWIISRLGHMLRGAVLLDLDSQEIESAYSARRVVVSPDGYHIAHVHFSGFQGCVESVFVDNVMVYPEIVDELTISRIEGLCSSDGTHFSFFIHDTPISTRRIGQMAWANRTDLSFEVTESETANADLDDREAQWYIVDVTLPEVVRPSEPDFSSVPISGCFRNRSATRIQRAADVHTRRTSIAREALVDYWREFRAANPER